VAQKGVVGVVELLSQGGVEAKLQDSVREF
jgi:hypothetical protein